MARLPVLIRQTKVFDLVVQGKSYAQICRQLKVSEDTVARDMTAIAEQVQQLVTERQGEVLAVALAQYEWVVACAKEEYRRELQRERDWWAGKLDYTQDHIKTKTLAVEGRAADDGPADSELAQEGDNSPGGFQPPRRGQESQPIEVTRQQRTVRPGLTASRERWLRIVIEATREITELCGIKKLTIDHQGTVQLEHLTDTERAARTAELFAKAQARAGQADHTQIEHGP
jgi:hypothetical protein